MQLFPTKKDLLIVPEKTTYTGKHKLDHYNMRMRSRSEEPVHNTVIPYPNILIDL